ncbi:MAG TPA: TonB-dependent receptor [Bacteroidales bacterium]|nr:TonB-dependent receptor [Bacteroidales bacterium]
MRFGHIISASLLLCILLSSFPLLAAPENITAGISEKLYNVSGIVIDKVSREPVPFATVSVWKGSKYAVTDTSGMFIIEGVPAGACRLQIDLLGYNQYISEEFMVSPMSYFVRAEIEEQSTLLSQVIIKPKAEPYRRLPESPLSQRTIGVQEIERNPGSNRDISRVVSSLPGVATVAGGGYRNDLLVRGGGPSENRFFLDGIEIPGINHFSTQGSSGGPVGIIDADFIREVDFYAGSFPVARGGAVSSVLDFKLKEGDPVKNRYKFTIGASEAGITSSGHLSKKTNYLVSARTSYLQLLFKAIGLPFLPSFTDAQFKIKTRFNNKHELIFIGIAGFDNMTLNEDTGGKESNEYILAYFPVIQQEVFTLGTIFRHYYGNNTMNLYLSHSYLNNRNTKYSNNDYSSEQNLSLKYRSVEQETKFRIENVSKISDFRLTLGAGTELPTYSNNTYQKIFLENPVTVNYSTNLSFLKYSAFANINYTSPDKRFTANAGARADGNSYSSQMANPFNQFSPRASVSYEIAKDFYLNASAGRYYQLPPLTAMGFKNSNGEYVNKGLKYIGSDQVVIGADYRNDSGFQATFELFHKWNFNGMYSVADSIPVEGKGINYGVVGNEEITSTIKGRSYGAELSVRWFVTDKFNLLASLTVFRSLFLSKEGEVIPRSWDNRRLMNISAGYKLPANFRIGAKFRYSGGSPYTPLDEDKSSLVSAWDASGRGYFNYEYYNTRYLGVFSQLDLRLDKNFYFNKFALKVYVDIQNALNTRFRNADVLVSTGTILNPDAPYIQQRYMMKKIELTEGTLVPTLGITVEF